MAQQSSGVFLWSTCEVLLNVTVSVHLTRSFEETPGDTRLLSGSSSLHLCGLCLYAAASNHHLQRVDSMSLRVVYVFELCFTMYLLLCELRAADIRLPCRATAWDRAVQKRVWLASCAMIEASLRVSLQ